MVLMTTVGIFVFFLSATVAVFFAGYLMGKLKTMKQLGSIQQFANLAQDVNKLDLNKESK